ncbi:MAG TPA: hypothetical protein VN255_01690 [Mycobacterium sp.]|nr:hypothetical protein [Mycobacterium sp.]
MLQLFLGLFGIGRCYIDSTQIAVAQLCRGLVGTNFSLLCFFGFPVLLGGIIWAIVDAIMMFTGSVKDNYGRKLRWSLRSPLPNRHTADCVVGSACEDYRGLPGRSRCDGRQQTQCAGRRAFEVHRRAGPVGPVCACGADAG